VFRDACPTPSPSIPTSTASRPSERAQSTVEFVGTLPLLALAATACLQALLVAVSITLAQVSVDRAARGQSRAQVVASLPPGWRERTKVSVEGSRASVRIEPPSLLPRAGRLLAVRATSEVTK
jgi:hypothetical protein